MQRSTLTLVLLLILSFSLSQAQFRATDFEIWFYNARNDDLTIEVSTDDRVWDEDYYLESTLYQGGSFEIDAGYSYALNSGGDGDYGFVIQIWDSFGYQPEGIDLSFGLYKIEAIQYNGSTPNVKSYFYLDLRDHMEEGSCIDTHLELQSDYNWSWMQSTPVCGEVWEDFDSTTTQTFWEFWEPCTSCTGQWAEETPDRTKFQPANPSSLTISFVSGHPKLNWTGTPELYGHEKYDVYRKVGTGSFTVIANNISNRYYTDTTVDSYPRNHAISYKIKSVSGDGNIESSGYSNTVYMMGDVQINKPSHGKETITEEDDGTLTGKVILSTYPNPFNPSTTLRYDLSENANISLTIYDVNGQVVEALVLGHQPAGQYEIIWNSQSTDGHSISAGVYFARIAAGDQSQTIKLLYSK